MLIILLRTFTFLCLIAHQILMYLMGILTVSVIGIFYFSFEFLFRGVEGFYSNPHWRIYFSIVCLSVLGVVFLMTTPVGERLLRLFFVMRKPTLREEPKVNQAAKIVKEAYKNKFQSDIKLNIYIVDSPFLNGFALGNSTIALNAGVVRDAEIEEIAAIIAHECAHLHYGDSLYNSMMFGAGSHLQLFFKGDKEKKQDNNTSISFLGILTIPMMILGIFLLPLIYIANGLDKAITWKIEYRADDFADELGFGKGLISFFGRLEAVDIRENHGFLKKYTYSHPPVMSRMDKIERKHLVN